MDQVNEVSLSQIAAQVRQSRRIFPHEWHLFARQDKKTRVCACSGLVLQDINDYLYHIYEQMVNAIIDEVNDGLIKTKD
jgi:hypothetical protein